jgi:N-acetylmuramoyl-L-alanine amidase
VAKITRLKWSVLGMRAGLGAAFAVLLAWAGIMPAFAQATVIAARVGHHDDRTRFVLDLSETVDYRIFTLADPYRIVVEMGAVEWRVSRAERVEDDGLIRAYRFGPYGDSHSRAVLDLSAPARVRTAFIMPAGGGKPARLVLDLEPQDGGDFRAAAGWPEERIAAPVPSRKPQAEPAGPVPELGGNLTDGRFVVTIDPGHGGIDPGATGVSGVHEKEIALAVGLELRKLLRKKGYEVVMTRDDDSFLKLKERVAVAREAQSDLFISIHADSIGKPGVRGASVYTLSETASDKEAEALAKAENEADVIAGVDLSGETNDVSGILIDLAQRETKNRSVAFAQGLLPHLGRQTRLLPETHRFAGFRVLKAPDVPSVLIELGFLSNSEDEEELMSEAWQRKIAASIAAAIVDYHERTTLVARR